MYSHILIPVSFAPNRDTEAAIRAGNALLNKDGRLTFLHVIEDLPAYMTPTLHEKLVLQAREEAAMGLQALQTVVPDAQVACESGHAGRVILDYAKRHTVDCIVVASHKPGFADYVIGSTAAHVVRNAQCGVHVVR